MIQRNYPDASRDADPMRPPIRTRFFGMPPPGLPTESTRPTGAEPAAAFFTARSNDAVVGRLLKQICQDGNIVLENDDWQTTQKQELEDTGLQPTNDLEAAIVITLQPGQYTAQVRGKGDASGIGVVQVYFLQ